MTGNRERTGGSDDDLDGVLHHVDHDVLPLVNGLLGRVILRQGAQVNLAELWSGGVRWK